MTLKYSTAAREFMASVGSFKDAFQNGRIEIYTGAQPANADAAVTGTLLCTLTSSSLARTAEVLATGTVTLSTGAAGSVSALTVNGVDIMGPAAVPYVTSLTVTAANLAAQINAWKGAVRYRATSSGAVVTITALPGTGATPNTFAVSPSFVTLTGASTAMASGVAPVNGLQWNDAVAGVLNILTGQTWSGVNGASNTAGWFRAYGSVADAGALDSALVFIREDGAISTSGAELNMASTALTSAATTTISAWQRTITTL